jgi:type 1 fimbria pilin
MSKKSFVGMMAAAAMAAAVGAGPVAFAKSKPATPSGDMNLRFQGYELAGTQQVSINGIGQLSVDTGGSITSGVETFSQPSDS